MKKFGAFVLVAIIFCVSQNAWAISDSEYKTMRSWLLGASGAPTGKYGATADIWCPIYPGCKHPGVDYGTNGGKIDAYAVCDGKVTATGGTYGIICIYNSAKNITFIYMHMSDFNGLKKGSTVKKGAKIGKTGKTGATSYHLHFEARSGEKTSAAAKYADTKDPYTSAKSCR